MFSLVLCLTLALLFVSYFLPLFIFSVSRFFKVYIFILRERERERERESTSRGGAISMETDAGLDTTDREIMT